MPVVAGTGAELTVAVGFAGLGVGDCWRMGIPDFSRLLAGDVFDDTPVCAVSRFLKSFIADRC